MGRTKDLSLPAGGLRNTFKVLKSVFLRIKLPICHRLRPTTPFTNQGGLPHKETELERKKQEASDSSREEF